jgi:predicted MFS family arabinose efflux permease
VGGLVLLVVGTGMVQDPGPVPAPVVLVAAVALLALFLVTQRRGRDPLLPRAALTDRALLVPLGVAFVNTATTSASGTLVALVAADLLGLGARATGFVLLPFSVMVVVGSAAGGFWLRRPRHVGMAVGLLVVAVAMAGLAVATGARSAALVAAAVAVAGLGLSWAAVTSTDAATAALPPAQQGTAAGAANTAAQVGTAVGVAVLLTVASLPRNAGTGFVVAFLCAAAVAAAASLALGLAARPRARTA